MLGTIAALGLIYVVGLIVYRRAFHPLAKYPGPWLASVTDWPNVFHSWRGDRPKQFYLLHKKYGPIVRYGPNRITMNKASGLPAIYGARANTQKAEWYRIWELLFGAPSTATILDHKTHSQRKRIMQQGFSDHSIRETEHAVIENVEVFCRILADSPEYSHLPKTVSMESEMPDPAGGWSLTKNLSVLVGFLTYDIMGDLVFSRSFSMQTSTENRSYMNMSLDALRGLNTVGYLPVLLKLKLDKLLFKELNAGMQRYKAYCAEQARVRIARSGELKRKDAFSSLINGKDPLTGSGLTTTDLQSEAAIVISAASHPIRTTLCAMTHYLVDSPTAMETLSAEIRSNFPHVDDIRQGPLLLNCHYLRACVKETLRLSPGVPGISLRTVLKGGLKIDDEFYPETTDIGVSTYAMQHHDEHYPDPFAFKPERWILADGEKRHVSAGYATADSLAKANEAFCAFSLGPMSCLGKNFAYHQIQVILARMIWTFEVRRSPHPPSMRDHRLAFATAEAMNGEYPLRDTFSAEGDGPWVQFRPRA